MKSLLMIRFTFLLFFLMTIPGASAQTKQMVSFKWKIIEKMPNRQGMMGAMGYAGAINEINNNTLIIAGGANFPNGMPWQGGKKYYSNDIYVLQKDKEHYFWNEKITDTLPEPVAYAAHTSTNKGIFFAGGENENGFSNKAYLLNFHPKKNKIEITPLPNLPVRLANMSATHIGEIIFVAGGDGIKASSDKLLSLDLADENPQWKFLADLPIALANGSLIAQHGKDGMNLFMIGGRRKTSSGISELHASLFIYEIAKNTWHSGATISDGKIISNLSAAAATTFGKNYIIIFGGDDGVIFHQIENYNFQIAQEINPKQKDALISRKNELVINHPGFSRNILLYNTITNTWKKIGELPYPAQVTTNALVWDNNFIISNGEIKPGVRTPDIIIAIPEVTKNKDKHCKHADKGK